VKKIIKHVTNIKNIYTYFEFTEYEDWDDFDALSLILKNKMRCKVIDILEGIWSRHCTFERDGFVFKLLYHEDCGNCLCNQNKKDEAYYGQLEAIANEVLQFLK